MGILQAYLFIGVPLKEDDIFILFNEKNGSYPRNFSAEKIKSIREEIKWKYKLTDAFNVLIEHENDMDEAGLESRRIGYAEDSAYIIGRMYRKMIIQDKVVQNDTSVPIDISDLEKTITDVQERLKKLGIEKKAQFLSISEYLT